MLAGEAIGLVPKKKGYSINNAVDELRKGLQPIIDTFKGIVDKIMKGNWEGAFNVIKTAAMNFWNVLKMYHSLFGRIKKW
jgi:soluble cytochrome b562